MTDIFDPVQFAEQVVTEQMDTKLIPVPVGTYNMLLEKYTVRQNQGKQDPTKVYVSLDITWEVLDEGVKSQLSRDKVTVPQSIMLDIENGRIAVGAGKNVGLGKLRQALGLNVPGEPFSLGMIAGRMAKGTVYHDPYNGEIYSKVKSVEAIN